MFFLSIVLMFFAVFFLRNKLNSRFFSISLAFLFFLLFFVSGFYYVANFFSGNGIGESVFFHLTMDMGGAGFKESYHVIILTVLYVLAIFYGSFFVYNMVLLKSIKRKNKLSVVFSAILIVISFYFNPGVAGIYKHYASVSDEIDSVEYPAEYMVPKNIEVNNKNFVYIYLESFERTYLDEKLFPSLTPNLNKLGNEALVFTDIRQIYGSGWTIAGMVNSQCGIPLITPNGNNAMLGADSFLPNAVCIGDILNDKGYKLNYVGGANLDFAGKGSFYASHHFNKIDGLDELVVNLEDPEYLNSWGLYDDSLFEIVKQRFDVLASKGEPFGLFALTLDTHHPRGHESAYCANVHYADGKEPMLNAIHCADKMVADFVEHIRASDIYDNTVIVISSDHLAMRNTTYERLQQGNRKNLFMILGQGLKPEVIERPGALIDVAPTLLSVLGADIDGLGFGRNLLVNAPTFTDSLDDINLFLANHRGFFSSLWFVPKTKDRLPM